MSTLDVYHSDLYCMTVLLDLCMCRFSLSNRWVQYYIIYTVIVMFKYVFMCSCTLNLRLSYIGNNIMYMCIIIMHACRYNNVACTHACIIIILLCLAKGWKSRRPALGPSDLGFVLFCFNVVLITTRMVWSLWFDLLATTRFIKIMSWLKHYSHVYTIVVHMLTE